MANDLKNNISAAPILNEENTARLLAKQKALARKQIQIPSISSELSKSPVIEDVGMDKGDIGIEPPSRTKKQQQWPEEVEDEPTAEEHIKETQEQTESLRQQVATQTAGNLTMAAQRQQRAAQIRRTLQQQQHQLEESTTKVKTFTKKIAKLKIKIQEAKSLTRILQFLLTCTGIGIILAFFVKHIVNFFMDPNKIQNEIDGLQKEIRSEENNKKQLEKSVQAENRILNQA